jgi:hypothetical protein
MGHLSSRFSFWDRLDVQFEILRNGFSLATGSSNIFISAR